MRKLEDIHKRDSLSKKRFSLRERPGNTTETGPQSSKTACPSKPMSQQLARKHSCLDVPRSKPDRRLKRSTRLYGQYSSKLYPEWYKSTETDASSDSERTRNSLLAYPSLVKIGKHGSNAAKKNRSQEQTSAHRPFSVGSERVGNTEIPKIEQKRRQSSFNISAGVGSKKIGFVTPVTSSTPDRLMPQIVSNKTKEEIKEISHYDIDEENSGNHGYKATKRKDSAGRVLTSTDRVISQCTSPVSDLTLPGDLRGTGSVTSLDDEDAEGQGQEQEMSQKRSISDSEEYDTDLEMDENFLTDSISPEDRYIGKEVYERACKTWGTSPQHRFLNSLPYRSLSLRHRSLGSAAVPPLCAALKDNLRVERLNLEGTDINGEGSQYIAEMLLDNMTVSHINLANNNMGMRGAQVMGHVMTVTQTITHMNLSGNKMDDKSAWYISTGLGANNSLTHLDLSYNEFCEKAGALIGGSLAQNRKLRYLNISWNKVRGKGAVAIFQALMFNSSLEVLDISWNGIAYEGAVVLSKALKRNTGLKEVDVSNNRIDWRGASLISEGLKDNCTLNKLKIGFNPLTTTGCMDLLQAAACITSALCLLDASEVCVLGEADLLAATISRRRKFQFRHGGIVASHDTLGARMEREINPMLRVIEYLRVLGLRPLELMKSFDRNSSFELPRAEFVENIKKIGVKLHKFEIEALANSVSAKGFDHNLINYRKLSMAVREVVREERERKLKEREEWKQIKSYHTQILQKGVPDAFKSSKEIFGNLSDRSLLRVGNSVSPMDSFCSLKSPTNITGTVTATDISPKSRQSKVLLVEGAPMASTGSLQIPQKKQPRRFKTANNFKHV